MTYTLLQKCISNKYCSYELSIHQIIVIQIYNSFDLHNIDKHKCFSRNIKMISEGSCDTEDCSNDAEKSALYHRNKLHFTIYSNR